MPDVLPRYAPGDRPPILVGSGGITGGQPITTTGVAAANTETKCAGIADRDGVQGAYVGVIREGIANATASAAIANGDLVCCAGTGKFRTYVVGTDSVAAIVGRAWSAAAGNNSVFLLALYGV